MLALYGLCTSLPIYLDFGCVLLVQREETFLDLERLIIIPT